MTNDCPYKHICETNYGENCSGSADSAKHCTKLDDPDYWFR